MANLVMFFCTVVLVAILFYIYDKRQSVLERKRLIEQLRKDEVSENGAALQGAAIALVMRWNSVHEDGPRLYVARKVHDTEYGFEYIVGIDAVELNGHIPLLVVNCKHLLALGKVSFRMQYPEIRGMNDLPSAIKLIVKFVDGWTPASSV